MTNSKERFMRMMVFFDLPTLTSADRRHAAQFRIALLREGYYMMQWSIYSRICKGMADVEKHSKRLNGLIPPTGSVRLMRVTEKQFADMEILVGESKKTEKIGAKQMLLF
jgi:CRISPR-associated protein Cas2